MNLPPPPNVHALAVLILAAAALVLFTREKIPLEFSSFLVLMGIAIGFEVFPPTLVVGAFISAFINNVPVVVLFLPILINVPLRTGMKASSVDYT